MSSPPTLYYMLPSPPARSVLLVAKALGLELDLKPVDVLKCEHLTPEFLKMNPQHTVPTLDDNGKYIWDSHAINTYLVDKYGNSDDHPLYPKDLYTRARIDQRLHFDSGVLFSSLAAVIRSVLLHGASELDQKLLQNAYAALETLNTFLAVDPYLVGDNLTVADLSTICGVTQFEVLLSLDATKYPNIFAWIQRLKELPYFYEINTINIAEFKPIFEAVWSNNKASARE